MEMEFKAPGTQPVTLVTDYNGINGSNIKNNGLEW
jgi:hypothetical protein